MVDSVLVAARFRFENERERTLLVERRLHAQQVGRELARRILDAYPDTRRVWGFGSTFETWRGYRLTSDIDLAVESGDVIKIMSLTEESGFPVDVVDLSSCHPSMAKFIREQGTVLAGAVP